MIRAVFQAPVWVLGTANLGQFSQLSGSYPMSYCSCCHVALAKNNDFPSLDNEHILDLPCFLGNLAFALIQYDPGVSNTRMEAGVSQMLRQTVNTCRERILSISDRKDTVSLTCKGFASKPTS